MTDFLSFLLPASLMANAAMLYVIISDIKESRATAIKLHSYEAEIWRRRSKKYRKVVRFLDPQTALREKFSEDVKQLQDEGWTFDEGLSVNGHMAFYKEEEIKDKFID